MAYVDQMWMQVPSAILFLKARTYRIQMADKAFESEELRLFHKACREGNALEIAQAKSISAGILHARSVITGRTLGGSRSVRERSPGHTRAALEARGRHPKHDVSRRGHTIASRRELRRETFGLLTPQARVQSQRAQQVRCHLLSLRRQETSHRQASSSVRRKGFSARQTKENPMGLRARRMPQQSGAEQNDEGGLPQRRKGAGAG